MAQETGIDVIVITHEHADHVHVPALKEVLANNTEAIVIANSSVSALLTAAQITCTVLEGTGVAEIAGVRFEAFDCMHEEIYEEIGQVQNTGYFIGDRLFYPGDSFGKPGKPVDVLALPVAGPWCKLSDAIRYAIAVKPNKAFPVHDALIKDALIGSAHRVPGEVLPKNGIEFIALREGETADF
ncbi:MAG: MBL fold metallo-hydrolase, partial [Candidatus Pacebacteria bacterium]|nr:MBL fold metallo-hydrolase [Candidatus Paceibacterota bacterium]